MTERVCFLMRLKQEGVADYLRAHEAVWPEMLLALSETGWSNYSLFISENDGLVVGYFETDDYERAMTGIASRDVNARWQALMAQYFVSPGNPDESTERLAQYFHLA
jgi:L-rhamnose mutarotase